MKEFINQTMEDTMDNNNNKQANNNLESDAETADMLNVPEGVKQFVDIIGDEKMDQFGNPASNFEQ
ncbi:hypothetical protein [Paenibacillus sp. RC67]|uniref:hypothetical protein n=1 Tax=Paenibacillus sp. RC67 TaxID=3039392 RepID=UPI0024AD897A|nr:hypothetical protein [Paenibacillus sp. RC67]